MLSIPSTLIEEEIKDSFAIRHLNNKCDDHLPVYRLKYNRIFLINRGVGEVKIDDSNFKIGSDELLLVSKGQMISFQAGSAWTGYELTFGDCFWERTPTSASNCKAVLFNDASANQQLPLTKEDHKELGFYFQSLLRESSKEEYTNKLDAMAAFLKIIMIKIANVNAALSKGFDSHENKLYHQFLELISQHYQSSREVSDYAKLLGISPRKLADLSKRCGGKSAKDLINGQLIAEAKRSLQFSSTPVKEIAFQLNFSTPDQFSHFFKKNTRVSPQDYRTLFLNLGIR